MPRAMAEALPRPLPPPRTQGRSAWLRFWRRRQSEPELKQISPTDTEPPNATVLHPGIPSFSELLERESNPPRRFDVEVQLCVPPDGGSTFTLVSFGSGPSWFVVQPTSSVPVADWNVILACIHSLTLDTLFLRAGSDKIDQSVLRAFIARHSRITAIHLETLAPTRPICLPPVVMPRLKTLVCGDAAMLPALLASVEFSDSATLLEVTFTLRVRGPRDTQALQELKNALRCVARWGAAHHHAMSWDRTAGTGISLGVEFVYVPEDTDPPNSVPIEADNELRAVILSHGLQHVRQLSISSFLPGGFTPVREMLRWLAFFDRGYFALYGVVINVLKEPGDGDAELQEWRGEVAEAFPLVATAGVEFIKSERGLR
ncbi:hypothetical protein MKEN_00960400 [Mycena kentingensis (nom. inval.)]|nr:hypothetical protein MKEN_00960400 [Mycena kentingensis (nom. inval.)]